MREWIILRWEGGQCSYNGMGCLHVELKCSVDGVALFDGFDLGYF